MTHYGKMDAMVHSTHKIEQVDFYGVIEQEPIPGQKMQTEYLVCTADGIYCKAIYNTSVDLLYADDIYARLTKKEAEAIDNIVPF